MAGLKQGLSAQENFKSGYAAVVGAPNVGKSSLINAIVREKVAIVSPRPQTTRNRILGIKTAPEYQIVFIDTPGEIKKTAADPLNDYMAKSISSGAKSADVVLFVMDALKGFGERDQAALSRYLKSADSVIVVLNKVDLVNYEQLFPILARLNEHKEIFAVVPVSAKSGRNLDELEKQIVLALPKGEKFFADDEYTDKPARFLAAEIIREKALWLLNDEVPHGIAVDITKFEEGATTKIEADLICEREGHKNIIVGANAAKIKEISTKARITLEKLLGGKVYLNIFVKVRENWRQNASAVSNLGYDKKDIK